LPIALYVSPFSDVGSTSCGGLFSTTSFCRRFSSFFFFLAISFWRFSKA
jgi:hypothetical protein